MLSAFDYRYLQLKDLFQSPQPRCLSTALCDTAPFTAHLLYSKTVNAPSVKYSTTQHQHEISAGAYCMFLHHLLPFHCISLIKQNWLDKLEPLKYFFIRSDRNCCLLPEPELNNVHCCSRIFRKSASCCEWESLEFRRPECISVKCNTVAPFHDNLRPSCSGRSGLSGTTCKQRHSESWLYWSSR